MVEGIGGTSHPIHDQPPTEQKITTEPKKPDKTVEDAKELLQKLLSELEEAAGDKPMPKGISLKTLAKSITKLVNELKATLPKGNQAELKTILQTKAGGQTLENAVDMGQVGNWMANMTPKTVSDLSAKFTTLLDSIHGKKTPEKPTEGPQKPTVNKGEQTLKTLILELTEAIEKKPKGPALKALEQTLEQLNTLVKKLPAKDQAAWNKILQTRVNDETLQAAVKDGTLSTWINGLVASGSAYELLNQLAILKNAFQNQKST